MEDKNDAGLLIRNATLRLVLFLAIWKNYFGIIYFDSEIGECIEKENIFRCFV